MNKHPELDERDWFAAHAPFEVMVIYFDNETMRAADALADAA